jgi:hypothetical protein
MTMPSALDVSGQAALTLTTHPAAGRMDVDADGGAAGPS